MLPRRLPKIDKLRPRQNGHHFPDGIFKCILLNENVWISIKISLKYVPKGPINNILSLLHIMAWRRLGEKPLSGPMMVRSPMHICITRPQWVKRHQYLTNQSHRFENLWDLMIRRFRSYRNGHLVADDVRYARVNHFAVFQIKTYITFSVSVQFCVNKHL